MLKDKIDALVLKIIRKYLLYIDHIIVLKN